MIDDETIEKKFIRYLVSVNDAMGKISFYEVI